ncbi:hypothetical protein, partial [Thauera sp. WH-1]|uniref:hypothetical protein n=1 Tax=Thauera sp. WH-1 TaxID=3398230 RepID=UPI0039FBBA7E
EDLVTARQRLLQTVQNIKLAVQAGIVPEGIQSRGYLRHRVCLLLRMTAWIIPQECFLTPRAKVISVAFSSRPTALLPFLIQSSSSVTKVPPVQENGQAKGM